MLPRLAPLLALLVGARAQVDPCCLDSAGSTFSRLQLDTQYSGSVSPGAYTEYYFVAENEGDSLSVEISARTGNSAALGVYVFDAKPVNNDPLNPTPLQDRCLICEGSPTPAPISTVEIASISTFHPATSAPSSMVANALDMDLVSHIGNTTHRRYYAYIGECYQMMGSVYYLSIYGQSQATTSFTVQVRRVPSALPIASSADGAFVTGSVCDGKYMHYYVDWPIVTAGGMQALVRRTSGQLDNFYVRKEQCAGTQNLFGPINLMSFGCAPPPLRAVGRPLRHATRRRAPPTIGGSLLCWRRFPVVPW
jgi:hypothetical protein